MVPRWQTCFLPRFAQVVLPRGAALLWNACAEVPRTQGSWELRTASLWDAGGRRTSLGRRPSPCLLTEGPEGERLLVFQLGMLALKLGYSFIVVYLRALVILTFPFYPIL